MPSKTLDLVSQLLNEIDSAVSTFNQSVPDIQKNIFDRIQNLLKDLQLNGDRIANSVENNRAIGALKSEIERIILNKKYINQVAQFSKAFDVITTLQNKLFSAQVSDFKASAVLNAMKQDAIKSTVVSLTESGISAKVTEGIQGILRTNIKSGGKYSDLIDQMRSFITTDEKGIGALERHARQITTDSLNQYSAVYNQAVSADLGLKWRMYVGSNLATTRAFCQALSEKKYYHIDELPEILKGHIDTHTIKINPKTGVWAGGIPGTTVENFANNRGGYNCGHQDFGVTEAMVPKDILARHKGVQAPPITPNQDGTSHPKSKPVSEAFTHKDSAVSGFVDNALSLISTVHGDGDLQQIPVRELINEPGYGGYFRIDPKTLRPAEIRVNPRSAHPELSFIHELGHFIDYNVLGGTKKSMASEFRPDEMEPVMQAIFSSRAITKLEDFKAAGKVNHKGRSRSLGIGGQEYLDYLTSDAEVWARAYAQYIAIRSRDSKLLKQLDITRESPDPVNSLRQWSDDDFEKIAEAIDEMFVGMKWMVKKTP